MKNKPILLIAAFVLSFAACIPAKAQETKPEAKKEQKVDYGDAFLQLALEKTKLYSGKVEDAVGAAIDVSKKEAPEMMKEFLIWRAWKHGIYSCITLIPLVLLIYFIRYANKNGWDGYGPTVGSMGVIFSSLFLMFALAAGGDNIMKFIQIKVAPRIYIAEEVINLIKKN